MCKYGDCKNPPFSKGLCMYHQVRKPIAKYSKKRKASIGTKKIEVERMWIFFLGIWQKRLHVCQSCGIYLGNEPRSYMFDHLLEKSQHPELKYDEDNIFLCCLECHNNKTAGHPSETHSEAIRAYQNKSPY